MAFFISFFTTFLFVSFSYSKNQQTEFQKNIHLRYDLLLKGSTEQPFKLENDGLTKDIKTNNNLIDLNTTQ